MCRSKFAILALVAASLAGCATSALDIAPDRSDRPWSPTTTATGEIVPGEQSHGGADGYVLSSNQALSKLPDKARLDASKPYSLAELIDIAETSNPATRIAWNDARRVALAEGIAESAFLPKITASAVGAYQGNNGNVTALGYGASGSNSVAGTISAVQFDWLLFDFGQRRAVLDAAKQVSVISNIAFTAAHQQVIYEVCQAFYAHEAARARDATARQSLTDAQAVQAAAEDRRRHGIGTVIEVAQARQATAQANLAMVQAKGGVEDSYIALIAALGISPLTRIEIADLSERQFAPEADDDVERIVSEALARRPDMLAAFAAEKVSQANVRAAEAEFLPKFFVSATGAYNSGRLGLTALPPVGQQGGTVNISGSHLGGSVLAGISLPLYDGGTRSALLKQAEAEADNAEAKLAKIRDEAAREIVRSQNALQTSLSAFTASQTLAAAAQITFDAALAAYRDGVGSITEATLAETQLLQARNATTDAHSAALSSAATLALAAGTLGSAPDTDCHSCYGAE